MKCVVFVTCQPWLPDYGWRPIWHPIWRLIWHPICHPIWLHPHQCGWHPTSPPQVMGGDAIIKCRTTTLGLMFLTIPSDWCQQLFTLVWLASQTFQQPPNVKVGMSQGTPRTTTLRMTSFDLPSDWYGIDKQPTQFLRAWAVLWCHDLTNWSSRANHTALPWWTP